MIGQYAGAVFHGEFSSADASALTEPNSRFLLYGAGSTSAVTLNANDEVTVTDLKIMAGSALTVTVYDGSDATADAGEVISAGDYAANGGEAQNFTAPHVCQKGTYPKLKASGAGTVKAQIRGYICRKGS
jgi:hypothetical protein